MRKFLIALILVASVPAVVSASSNLMNEVTGQNEVVADGTPYVSDDRLISSKSSRPRPAHVAQYTIQQPEVLKISADLL